MTALDGPYHPVTSSVPSQKANFTRLLGTGPLIQAPDGGQFMPSTQTAELGSKRVRQPVATYNADDAYPHWLLPGQLRHSKTFPCTDSLEEQRKTDRTLSGLQLRWQEQEDWLEHHGPEDCAIIYPELMVRHAQSFRSLQMRCEHRQITARKGL